MLIKRSQYKTGVCLGVHKTYRSKTIHMSMHFDNVPQEYMLNQINVMEPTVDLFKNKKCNAIH